MTTLSKAEKALHIYTTLVEAGKEGKELKDGCVEKFTTELEMSTAGASTYFYNTKKKASGGEVKSYYKGKDSQDPSSDEDCSRKLYSIVNAVDDKVESTESHYDFKKATKIANGRLVVIGLPDLDVSVNTLKQAKR